MMFHKILLTVVGVLLLTACTKEPQVPAQPHVALHVVADAELNPGATGHAAPVRVRIYELKSAASFLRADFFALAERAQPTLGADLIDQDEVWIHPGEQRQLSRVLNPETLHVGLVVAYRDIDQAQWRTLLTLAPRHANKFLITLDARNVRSDVVLTLAQ